MKQQTSDNLRCLGAVVAVLVIPAIEFTAQEMWLPFMPAWTPVVLFILLLPVVLYFFNSKQKRDRVTFDDILITCPMPDGSLKTVRWDELQEIGILTTDEGPAREDVYWVLLGTNGNCVAAASADGTQELLARMQLLPGFDNAAVIKAMGCTSNAKFVCWKRDQLLGDSK